MKISYTGKSEEIPTRQRAKLEAKLQKLAKVLEQRGEKEAHVVLTQQRFLHKVEITMNAWDHALVGIASDGDIAVAAHEAFARLEKQLLKLRSRWRDTKRVRDKEADGEKASATLHPAAAVPKKAKAASKANSERQSGTSLPAASFNVRLPKSSVKPSNRQRSGAEPPRTLASPRISHDAPEPGLSAGTDVRFPMASHPILAPARSNRPAG